MTYYKGDVVEWIGGTRTVGPYKEVAITNSEKREVIVGGTEQLWLAGANEKGLYGTVSVHNVKLVKRGDTAKLLGVK